VTYRKKKEHHIAIHQNDVFLYSLINKKKKLTHESYIVYLNIINDPLYSRIIYTNQNYHFYYELFYFENVLQSFCCINWHSSVLVFVVDVADERWPLAAVE
jgi:hypothetical protein